MRRSKVLHKHGGYVDVGAVESNLAVTKPVVRNEGTTVNIPNTLAATSNKSGNLYPVLKTALIINKVRLDVEVTDNRGTIETAVADTIVQILTKGLTE